jgi:hypothetical protein
MARELGLNPGNAVAPNADALASKAYIHALALGLRRAGLPGSLDQLRLLVFADLTSGRDPLDRLTRPASPAGPEPATPDPAAGDTVTADPADPAAGDGAAGGTRFLDYDHLRCPRVRRPGRPRRPRPHHALPRRGDRSV